MSIPTGMVALGLDSFVYALGLLPQAPLNRSGRTSRSRCSG